MRRFHDPVQRLGNPALLGGADRRREAQDQQIVYCKETWEVPSRHRKATGTAASPSIDCMEFASPKEFLEYALDKEGSHFPDVEIPKRPGADFSSGCVEYPSLRYELGNGQEDIHLELYSKYQGPEDVGYLGKREILISQGMIVSVGEYGKKLGGKETGGINSAIEQGYMYPTTDAKGTRGYIILH
ncbi:hypothetical protein B0H13DRAFT_2268308 [Mycena leptocephala]|nr:hypothetical protein B0H13DRAFT_2268308 [Mycena leptocephala]